MAVEHIDNEHPLVIANFDQLIEPDLVGLFKTLRDTGCDAGCLTFDAVHPRWSYVRLEDERVVEAAEKRPLSRHAIAEHHEMDEMVEALEETEPSSPACGGSCARRLRSVHAMRPSRSSICPIRLTNMSCAEQLRRFFRMLSAR